MTAIYPLPSCSRRLANNLCFSSCKHGYKIQHVFAFLQRIYWNKNIGEWYRLYRILPMRDRRWGYITCTHPTPKNFSQLSKYFKHFFLPEKSLLWDIFLFLPGSWEPSWLLPLSLTGPMNLLISYPFTPQSNSAQHPCIPLTTKQKECWLTSLSTPIVGWTCPWAGRVSPSF